MKFQLGLVLALSLLGLAPPVFGSPASAQVRAFVAMHDRIRARLPPAERQLADELCARVRAAVPPRARLPDDVRALLARSMTGLSVAEIDVLADYVSGDAGVGAAAEGDGIGGTGGGMAGGSAIGAARGGDSQSRLMQATQQMQETQMSFNLQYLQLQNQMQNENRQYTAVSNILKTKHDTLKNSIRNIR